MRSPTADIPNAHISLSATGAGNLEGALLRRPDRRVSARTPGGLGLAFTRGSAARIRRTPQHVVNDDLILNIRLAGVGTLSQRGRNVTIGEGEAVLTAGAEVSEGLISESRLISLRIPHKAIAPLVADLDDHIALALGATRDAAETAKMGGVRTARLHAVMAGIDQYLANPALSAAWLGAQLSLSDRYVHLLVAGTGTSFSDLVRRKRVELARKMLEQPRAVPRRIVDVAYAVGFGDLSNFNRAFRQRFDCTPSDVQYRR